MSAIRLLLALLLAASASAQEYNIPFRPLVDLCTQMSTDDFSTDTIGSTWQVGRNGSLHPVSCLWSINSASDGLVKWTVLSSSACEPSLDFSLGRSEAASTVNQYSCIVWDSRVSVSPMRMIFRMDSQTDTTNNYYQVSASAISTSKSVRKPDGTSATSCTNGAQFDLGDQLCGYVTGTGTSTVIKSWVSNAGSHLTGDPDTWRSADCCWNEDGSSGCTDYGTFTGGTVKDTGNYQGLRVPGSSDFAINDYIAMDNWVAGSCN